MMKRWKVVAILILGLVLIMGLEGLNPESFDDQILSDVELFEDSKEDIDGESFWSTDSESQKRNQPEEWSVDDLPEIFE